jgi:hypothetical protein
MTDDEARKVFSRYVYGIGSEHGERMAAAIQHALQAIEDRATLIHWHYDNEIEITEESVDEMVKAYETVRRHARGGE